MMQEFVARVNETAKAAADAVHTAIPGVIVKYDPASNRATVQPKAKFRKPDGKTMDYPKISGVPVLFPQSSSVKVAWPVKAGDGCLLICCEEALDYWMYGKETPTILKHDLTNAVAITGLSAKGNEVIGRACSENAVVVKSGGTVLTVKPSEVVIEGKLRVTGDVTTEGNLLATGDVKAEGGMTAGRDIDVSGNMSVSGAATVAGDVTGRGVSLASHTHTDSMGGGTTGPS